MHIRYVGADLLNGQTEGKRIIVNLKVINPNFFEHSSNKTLSMLSVGLENAFLAFFT
jgi:hypothetical protein